MPISHVFDTFAKSSKGRVMHFDVVLEQKDSDMALNSAKKWLASIGEANAVVNQENCVFCHSAEAPEELQQQISAQGYAIHPMEGCPR
jgi:hypothetical protein